MQGLAGWLDARAREAGIPPAEARILGAHVLGLTRTQLLTRDAPEGDDAARVRALLARRAAGEPVAYLVGTREFFGRAFGVGPGVLVPRPETEGLVERALTHLSTMPGARRVLDLGTGSGVVGITLALERPDLAVTLTDDSPAALARALDNARALGAAVRGLAGDWYAALPEGEPAFDCIVSNPPYIAAHDDHLSQGDLRHEPPGALTDFADGLRALAAIVVGAPARLRPGGLLALEHGHDQGEAIRTLLRTHGLQAVTTDRDLAGHERITHGHRA